MKKRKSTIIICASCLFWTAVWLVLAAVVKNGLLLPGPVAVFSRLGELALTEKFIISVLKSVGNVMLGFITGNILGIAVGIISGVSEDFETFIRLPMTVIKATPVASFIIIILVWLGRDLTPACTSFLIVLPIIWENVAAGVKKADRALIEMATVFRLRPSARLKYIYLPQILPVYTASVKSGIGLAWKAGVAAEVLVAARNTLGGQIYNSKITLEITDLFAWTTAVVIASLIIEVAAGGVLGKLQEKAKK